MFKEESKFFLWDISYIIAAKCTRFCMHSTMRGMNRNPIFLTYFLNSAIIRFFCLTIIEYNFEMHYRRNHLILFHPYSSHVFTYISQRDLSEYLRIRKKRNISYQSFTIATFLHVRIVTLRGK